MDYETFYQKILPLEKGIKDRLAANLKTFKKLYVDSEKGDIKNYAKDITQLQTIINEQAELLVRLQEETESFDISTYVENGDFAEQLEYECRKLSIDVKGTFPVYEMFPYHVKIDTEELDIIINGKKWQCLRPVSFAREIKTARDKLFKASFNAQSFTNELCAAYDTAILFKNKKTPGSPNDAFVSLKEVYNYLVPMQRYRKDYDAQSYAFDLARLYSIDPPLVKDGRRLDFGTSKSSKKFIRILDMNGHEHQLTTIRFYLEEGKNTDGQ